MRRCRTFTLAALVKPSMLLIIAKQIVAVSVLALGAQLTASIPGTAIPQTGQTIAVLVIGAMWGPRYGPLAIVLYLLLGGLGFPLFSEGGAGWSVLFGSSAGYFAGFVAAAALMGGINTHSPSGLGYSCVFLFFAMLVGHGVILLCGFAGLTVWLSVAEAWQQGVAPFLYGVLVKSIIAGVLVLMLERLRMLKLFQSKEIASR